VSTALDKTGASAVVLGVTDEKGVEYTGLDQALADPEVEVRLFAKPEAFVARRMGVALAAVASNDVDEARAKAVKAASYITVQKNK
jgi:phosphoribosylglycinamide formyltransferase 2